MTESYVLNFNELFISLQSDVKSSCVGLRSNCSILNGQMVYIEKYKLNTGHVTYFLDHSHLYF